MKITEGYLTDLHIHSSFSHDSEEVTENYIKKAIERGDKRIGIVQHYDYDYFLVGNKNQLCDLDGYKNEIRRLRDVYGDKISVLFGIEFGYDKRAEGRYAELVDKYKFDYVINSTHLIGGKDCCLKECWSGRSSDDIYKEYLEKVYMSVNASYPWQIVGHLGYPTRYAPQGGSDFCFEKYLQEIKDIFKAMLFHGKFLEINTSTKTEKPFIPSEDIIKEYAASGGKSVTFGSDAHSALRYAEKADEVKKIADKYGLKIFG